MRGRVDGIAVPWLGLLVALAGCSAPSPGDAAAPPGGGSEPTFAPVCVPAQPQVPGFRYVAQTCVARLSVNPADPYTPLEPNAREHCNPVIAELQRRVREQAESRCALDAYVCVPIDPAACPTSCVKDLRPGPAGVLPRTMFRPDARDCEDEPVNKHACEYSEFYECGCACAGVEDA